MSAPWLIRVASHPRHGGGHLARCRVLAAALREAGAGVALVLDEGTEAARAALERQGFDCRTVGAEGVGPWAGCVLDGYDILREETAHWCRVSPPMAVIDDFLDPPAGTALVINGAPHLDGDAVNGVPALLGPAYALVDPRFAALPERDRTAPVKRILISFGRLDPDNITARAVEAVAALRAPLAVTVVLPSNSPHIPAVRAAVMALDSASELILDAPDMLRHLAAADLAVGAGGVSQLERMAAGVPSITVSIVDNQRLFVEGAVRRGGTVDGGDASTLTAGSLSECLLQLLTDGDLRRRIVSEGRALIDGWGSQRVAAHVLQLAARQAEKQQERINI